MYLAIDLDSAITAALGRLAIDRGQSLEEAAVVALTDWLLSHRYLELPRELDEETATPWEA